MWPLILQVILIGINAVFACAEIALLSLNDNKLEKQASSGNRKAVRLRNLKKEPAKFLATIQVGITLAGFLGSAFAADNFSGKLAGFFISLGLGIPPGVLEKLSLISITLLLSFCTLVLGELVPKRLAMKKAEALAYAMSGLIMGISRLFAPVVWLLTRATNGMLRLMGINPEPEEDEVTEEEIRLMIDLGSARGTIKAGEKEMLHNVFEFDRKTAGEVMTRRRNVCVLSLEDRDEDWERTILEERHSYFPVCGEKMDDIKGILGVREYLALKDRTREAVLKAALREPWFVPVTVHTDRLFRQMKKKRRHFAVVLDEHGSLVGIVTMNDLLEELVGDLEDDSSAPPERPLIERVGLGVWNISGAAPLEKVAREVDVPLPVDKYETFAGFVWSLLGRIPEDGSEEEVEAEGLQIHIEAVREHRLERALVRKVKG
jgi:putative hemolysin